MRILFVTPTVPFPPERDGQALIAYHLLKELGSRHNVTVLCFQDPGRRDGIENTTALGVEVQVFPKPKTSLPTFYLTAGTKRAWFQHQWYSKEMAQAIRQADLSGRYDLIVLHSPFVSQYLGLATKTPVIFQSVDSLSSWFGQMADHVTRPLQRLHLTLEAKRAKQIEERMLTLAQRVVVVAHRDRDIMAANSPAAKIVVLPNGVDTNHFQPTDEPSEENTIIFTGVMDYPPNVDAVMRFYKTAWPQLADLRSNVRWLIVGKNPTPAVTGLQSQDPRITVTGYVADLRPWLQRATVYVAPLVLGTGFKNKVIEAMAAGKAVIATPEALGGLNVVHGQDVIIIPAIKDFPEAILRLFDRPMEREALGQHARLIAEQSSWTAVAAQYEQLYQETVDSYGR